MEQWNRRMRENSPYRPHTNKKQQFSLPHCCGRLPEKTQKQIQDSHPESGEPSWFFLYQCPCCQQYFLMWNGKFKVVDSLLKYQVREGPPEL